MVLTNTISNLFNLTLREEQAIVSGIVALCFIMLIIIINLILRQKIKNTSALSKTIRVVLQKLVAYVLTIGGMILIADVWNINIFPFLILLTIILLILIVCFKNSILDFINTINIVLFNWYKENDNVKIGEFSGVVKRMNLVTTTIVNWKGEELNISNRLITNVVNYSKSLQTGFVDIIIDNNEDIDKVIDILIDKLNIVKDDLPQIVEGPNVLGVIDLTNQGPKIRIVIKTAYEDVLSMERNLRRFVKKTLVENDIKMSMLKVDAYDNQK